LGNLKGGSFYILVNFDKESSSRDSILGNLKGDSFYMHTWRKRCYSKSVSYHAMVWILNSENRTSLICREDFAGDLKY